MEKLDESKLSTSSMLITVCPAPGWGNQGVRGSERAGAVGDLARGLYSSPRRSPLFVTP